MPRPGGGASPDSQEGPQRLPRYWLFVLGSWVPPQAIFWTVIQSIIVPIHVAQMVGDQRKTIYLGYITTLAALGGAWGPCIGMWSDNCTGRVGCFGRRRPFMFAGSVLFCVALGVLNWSRSFWAYAGGMFLFTLLANINCTPYNAILPEIVPVEQRATSASITGWLSTITAQVAAALGVAVGQKLLSDSQVYYMAAAVSIFYTLPVGQIIVGARPGCCMPEIPPPPPIDSTSATSREQMSKQSRCCELLRLLGEGGADFFSAFRWRPFRWMAVVVVLQAVWVNLQSLFYIYWCGRVLYSQSNA